jgi:hypothetical protein
MITELTEVQYDILSKMDSDYCYPFRYFDDLKLTKKELSKEFKILREADLVFFANGLMDEDGNVCGSGYGIDSMDKAKVDKLIEDWEEKNLPTLEEFLKDKVRGEQCK